LVGGAAFNRPTHKHFNLVKAEQSKLVSSALLVINIRDPTLLKCKLDSYLTMFQMPSKGN
jgi:hypothetical protein